MRKFVQSKKKRTDVINYIWFLWKGTLADFAESMCDGSVVSASCNISTFMVNNSIIVKIGDFSAMHLRCNLEVTDNQIAVSCKISTNGVPNSIYQGSPIPTTTNSNQLRPFGANWTPIRSRQCAFLSRLHNILPSCLCRPDRVIEIPDNGCKLATLAGAKPPQRGFQVGSSRPHEFLTWPRWSWGYTNQHNLISIVS